MYRGVVGDLHPAEEWGGGTSSLQRGMEGVGSAPLS
jgi:hypothetical protein